MLTFVVSLVITVLDQNLNKNLSCCCDSRSYCGI